MSGLCDPASCHCTPLRRVVVVREVTYSLGLTDSLHAGEEYDVHHESPWGPVLYKTNDLGHRLIVHHRDVREL